MNFITVVIPCYNEFNSLPILIENLEKINNINFLIIDNGSTDESREYLNSKKLNENINTLLNDSDPLMDEYCNDDNFKFSHEY